MGLPMSSHLLKLSRRLAASWLAQDLGLGQGPANGSCCYFICRTLGTGWKVKELLCFSLFRVHCHCSLSINPNHHRKWVRAFWKGHGGSVQGKCQPL